MYLSIAIFHFSWKCNPMQISEFHITGGNFAQSANTINGYVIGHNRHKFNHTVLLLSAYGLIF
jgi:hypothetical protein